MAIPQQRDPEATRAALVAWFAPRLDGARDVDVVATGGSETTGYSSDTIPLTVTWSTAGGSRQERFVVRAGPLDAELGVFPEYDLETQFRVQRALEDTSDVPLAPMCWYEPDPSVLGVPFYVMAHVDGRVPADNLPYTMDGWLLEAGPESQRRLWEHAIDTLAAIHRVDVDAAGLAFLRERAPAGADLDEHLAMLERYYRWSVRGVEHPLVETGLAWLREHRPAEAVPPALSWGDARIGNMIFDDDLRVAAVLDWEMVGILDPVADLAWMLFFQEHHSTTVGVPDLPGFPTRDESVTRWEAATDRTADHLDFWLVRAGVWFAAIMMRVTQIHREHGTLPADTTMEIDNPGTTLLDHLLTGVGR